MSIKLDYTYDIDPENRPVVTITKGKYAGSVYFYHPGVSVDPDTLIVKFSYEWIENPCIIEDDDQAWILKIGNILIDLLQGTVLKTS